MRTKFASAGHTPVTPVSFAAGHLRSQKAAITTQLRTVGFVPKEVLDLLEVELGDASDPVTDTPVAAIVNAGRWIAICDACGGAEYVDPEMPLLMCASCWNAAHGHQWRTVVLPDETTRVGVEEALLKRPVANRNWQPTETVADLLAENAANGVIS